MTRRLVFVLMLALLPATAIADQGYWQAPSRGDGPTLKCVTVTNDTNGTYTLIRENGSTLFSVGPQTTMSHCWAGR